MSKQYTTDSKGRVREIKYDEKKGANVDAKTGRKIRRRAGRPFIRGDVHYSPR